MLKGLIVFTCSMWFLITLGCWTLTYLINPWFSVLVILLIPWNIFLIRQAIEEWDC